MMKSEIDLTLLRSWLKEAGRIALRNRRSIAISLKADETIVTPNDLLVESYLLEQIKLRYPSHAVLTEESGVLGSASDWTWVIDPIDGTRAYASGLPIWGISIGLLHQTIPFAGGFYMPVTGELVWGDTRRAWYNGRRLHRLSPADLQSPTAFIAAASDFHQFLTLDFPRLRSFGSTAAHLTYVARGIALAAVTLKASLWDLAGLLPILESQEIEMAYLSGLPFRITEVLDGKKLPEPLIIAQPGILETIRQMIHSF